MNRRQFLHAGYGMVMLPVISTGFGDKTSPSVGIVYDKLFLEHWLHKGHPESPLRYQAIIRHFAEIDLLHQTRKLELLDGIESELLSIHTAEHVTAIQHRYGHSADVAVGAVSAGLAAVQYVCSGECKRVFCVTRPPGHHALNTGQEEGFCFYNNVAVAARYAQRHYHRKRILIVDWDYHHGNGTEVAFYQDPSVLFFSVHDRYAYPGTGDPAKIGEGRGKNYNINVHLDCNADDEDIVAAFQGQLAPAVRHFKPDLVLISAGFDSRKNDLLGCFAVTDQGFARLTRIVQGFADEYCDGCLVSLLEGGYSLPGLASAAAAHVNAMLETAQA